jgi:hypothetical protein
MSAASSTVSVELPGGQRIQAQVHRSPRLRVTRIQLGADRPLRVIVPERASDEFAVDAAPRLRWDAMTQGRGAIKPRSSARARRVGAQARSRGSSAAALPDLRPPTPSWVASKECW